jgi:hypothetical protein
VIIVQAGIVAGACVLIAAVIVLVLKRLVTSKNIAISTTEMRYANEKIRADAAEHAASVARTNHVAAARTAADAIRQTGEALHVARQIDTVAGQMDALMGLVMGEPVEVPPRGKHHALPGTPARPAVVGTVEGEYLP